MNNTPSQTFINQICELYGDVYDDRQEDSKINGRDWKPGEKSWHKSLKAFQEELATKGINLSTSKLRKILITGDCWSTAQSREIQKLYDRYESVARVAEALELSEAYVVMNLPYSRVVYDLEEKSKTAKRLNKHRGRGRTILLSDISDQTTSEYNTDMRKSGAKKSVDGKRTGRKGPILINPKIAEGLDRTQWKPENTEDEEAMDWALQQTMGETQKGDRLEFVIDRYADTRLYCAEIVKQEGQRNIIPALMKTGMNTIHHDEERILYTTNDDKVELEPVDLVREARVFLKNKLDLRSKKSPAKAKSFLQD